MYIDGDATTQELSRPDLRSNRERFRDIARDVREVALVTGSIVWTIAGATFLVGITRILTKVW